MALGEAGDGVDEDVLLHRIGDDGSKVRGRCTDFSADTEDELHPVGESAVPEDLLMSAAGRIDAPAVTAGAIDAGLETDRIGRAGIERVVGRRRLRSAEEEDQVIEGVPVELL